MEAAAKDESASRLAGPLHDTPLERQPISIQGSMHACQEGLCRPCQRQDGLQGPSWQVCILPLAADEVWLYSPVLKHAGKHVLRFHTPTPAFRSPLLHCGTRHQPEIYQFHP